VAITSVILFSEMKHITTLLFDVDGTLLDTEELIFQSLENTLRKQNQTVSKREAMRPLIGKPLSEVYQILTGKTDVDIFCQTHHQFQIQNLHLSKPFPNTYDTLKKLKEKSYKIAAVTTRKRKTTSLTLENANIASFIDFAVFADDVTHHKPHPEPFLKALSALNAIPDETVMIGDSEADILGGKGLDITTVGAAYGIQKEKVALSKPDFLIKDIAELLQILTHS
jgi:pyrophosphatase PpaX